MPTFNPRNSRVVCPKCGLLFANGFGFLNHIRTCAGKKKGQAAAELPDEEDVDNFGAMIASGSDDSSVRGEEVPAQPTSLEDHFEKMEALGTLDTEHVLKYTGWGKIEVQDSDIEICRFLRSNEVGGGASNAKSEAALLYAKTLGGRGDLLPKTMKTCWGRVDKVRCLWYNVHS